MTLRWGLLSTAHINDAFLAGVRESGADEVVAVAGEHAPRLGREDAVGQAHTLPALYAAAAAAG